MKIVFNAALVSATFLFSGHLLFAQTPACTVVAPPAQLELDNVKTHEIRSGTIQVEERQSSDVNVGDVNVKDVNVGDVNVGDVNVKDVNVGDVDVKDVIK